MHQLPKEWGSFAAPNYCIVYSRNSWLQRVQIRPPLFLIVRNLNFHFEFQPLIIQISFSLYTACGDISRSEQQISYRALNIKANKYASTILNLMPPSNIHTRKFDSIIGVCMDHSINMIATILGIWKAGAAYMPIEKKSPIDRLSFTVTEAKPMLVIYDDDYEKQAHRFGKTPKISFQKLESASNTEPTENIPTERTLTIGETDLAMVCYTSGSTGYPRGARLTHSNFYNRLDWQWETFPFSKTEKYAMFKTPFSFLDSVAEIWAPLLKGITLVIIPGGAVKNAEVFVSVLGKYQVILSLNGAQISFN